ncbi:DUF438 domain-containing protein [Anaeromyxobacter sp. Fw109-5]|uniref:DUF438 domain-containing protein n=1 Tax=Anaeromyxobacter sp. (strain Fw109-5) TaxID=404589 RepID=UPI0002FE0158|nr:DUF438 domain-containing protein [Anaeromyxobacter sp. Fw109-5]
MSELIETGAPPRKDLLKHLILQLHGGVAPDAVQRQLVRLLGQVPYGLVVEVEQELLADGMPAAEVTRLCHLHSAALQGAIDLSGVRTPPAGHPARVFSEENAALAKQVQALEHAADALDAVVSEGGAGVHLLQARVRVNALTDVEKHYLRKEHLLFPFLERHGITGPPQVMWGKHDQTRALLRAAHAALASAAGDPAAARALSDGALRPLASAIRDMVDKEENILLPMALDVLDEREWWEIARQSDEIGYCLVEPEASWRPDSVDATEAAAPAARVKLPTGSLAPAELEAILGALPLDATFVDAEDRVRWFSHGKERVFSRSRAVIGRKVQFCHPPSSVGTVETILAGFRAGTQDRASFWIQLRGRFVHIEYRALRDVSGAYLGCLEVTQDLTEKRALAGEQRLLSWEATAQQASAPVQACPAHPGAPSAAAPHPARAESAAARPAWLEGARVSRSLDARPLLAAGAHPVQEVMQELATLAPGAVFELVAPFVPGPLLERARAAGCLAHSEQEAPGLVRTWFTRGGAA